MRRDYANAERVLPRRVLRLVQRYWQGLLWVPVLAPRRRKSRADAARNERILQRCRRGRTTGELAAEFALSQERIRQIVREAKRRVK